MAVGVIFSGAGITQDQYFQTFNQVTDNGSQFVPGLISHYAGPTEGGFCVIEVWESREAVMKFFEEKLAEALAAANIDTRPTMFEVVNSVVEGVQTTP
jgi:heme-degrading monooxygenase HmoA